MTGDIVARTRIWQASIAAAEEAKPSILQVSSEIEVGNTNERPRLSLSEPASPDPSVLALNLDVVIDGPSELAMPWTSVTFRHSFLGTAPKPVRLVWMGVKIATLTVDK